MVSTEPPTTERHGMSVSGWLNRTFHLKAKPEIATDRVELVKETYDKVTEVRKLREDVLEGRNFPISDYLRGTSAKPTVHHHKSRRKTDGMAKEN